MTAVLSVLHHSSILKAAVTLLMVNCTAAPNITMFVLAKSLERAETLFGGRLHAVACRCNNSAGPKLLSLYNNFGYELLATVCLW